jgi:hypothetical protein
MTSDSFSESLKNSDFNFAEKIFSKIFKILRYLTQLDGRPISGSIFGDTYDEHFLGQIKLKILHGKLQRLEADTLKNWMTQNEVSPKEYFIWTRDTVNYAKDAKRDLKCYVQMVRMLTCWAKVPTELEC